MTKLYGLVTHQGTCMSETVLCGVCIESQEHVSQAQKRARRAGDWNGTYFHDVSENEAIHCEVCGTQGKLQA